jgi:hypothetical protein
MRYSKLLFSVILHCIVWYKDTDVWEKLLYLSSTFLERDIVFLRKNRRLSTKLNSSRFDNARS